MKAFCHRCKAERQIPFQPTRNERLCETCGNPLGRKPKGQPPQRTGTKAPYEGKPGTKPKPPTMRRCVECDTEFEARQEYRGMTRKFCSRACCWANRRRPVELVCDECGETFEVKSSQAKGGRRYCSRGCWAKNSRMSDDQYRDNAERMHIERRGRANPAFKHGRDGNRAWRTRFNLPLKGEDRCRACGSPENLHLHHAIPRSMSRAARDEILNGLPLCVHCHISWHRRGQTIYRDAFTEEEWAYLTSVKLTGQEIQPWLDERYPDRGRPFRRLDREAAA